MLIISDTSIKNNVATLVSYIYRDQEIIAKSVYYIMNITSIEAKLFTIRYRINHAIYLQDITCITTHNILSLRILRENLLRMFLHF